MTAVHTIDNNPYYGFNRDLGAVSAANYRTLTWTAWEVANRGNPGAPFGNYKGITPHPQEQNRLEKITSRYFRERNAFLNAEEEDPLVAARNKEKVASLKAIMARCGKLFI